VLKEIAGRAWPPFAKVTPRSTKKKSANCFQQRKLILVFQKIEGRPEGQVGQINSKEPRFQRPQVESARCAHDRP